MSTVVGFLMIGVSVTCAFAIFAALDERPPPSESVAQKLRGGLVGAALLYRDWETYNKIGRAHV